MLYVEVWDLCICFLKSFPGCLFPVTRQQRFGGGLLLLSPEFWCLTSISGCKEQTVS